MEPYRAANLGTLGKMELLWFCDLSLLSILLGIGGRLGKAKGPANSSLAFAEPVESESSEQSEFDG